MSWGDIFLIVAVVASLGFIIQYFLTEGFQGFRRPYEPTPELQRGLNTNRYLTNTRGGDSAAICSRFDKCSTCTDDTNHPGTQCGWCPAARACIPRSGTYRLVPTWLIDAIKLDPTKDCLASQFKHSKGQCLDDTCSDYTDCKTCAGALACGWCTTTNTCLSKEAVAAEAARGTSSGSPSGSPAPPLCAATITTRPETCPPPVCSTITDCGMCTQTTGCGFCKDTSRCISVDGNGSSLGGSDGSTGCAQGSIYTQLYQCPCSTLTACKDCAQRPGCGYCKETKMCLNLGRDNVADPKDCKPSDVATSTSQCVPNASQLSPGLVETQARRARDPSRTSLNMAADSGLLGGNELNAPPYNGPRGTGAGAVTAPRTTRYVSGNAVVRRYGDSSVPGGISRSADLSASPLEDYVKLLVRSELASEGVPMNEPFQAEPFQVNEADSIVNAESYLNKSMKNIIEK